MPHWVGDGYSEYAKRLPPECELCLHEIAAVKRSKNFDVKRGLEAEGRSLLAKVPDAARVVTLDVEGRLWSTVQLSKRMEFWMGSGQDVAFLVGGPEGLSAACKDRADETWSLSALTLPHPVVRVIVAEALYRAWSLLNNHPYHR